MIIRMCNTVNWQQCRLISRSVDCIFQPGYVVARKMNTEHVRNERAVVMFTRDNERTYLASNCNKPQEETEKSVCEMMHPFGGVKFIEGPVVHILNLFRRMDPSSNVYRVDGPIIK